MATRIETRAMYRPFALTLAVVGLLRWSPGAAADGFRVTAVSTPANYARTVDAGDLQQLSDGIEIAFPMWLSKASVGWHNVTPVRISGAAAAGSVAHPALAFRVARRDRAGVSPPRRIDVYCGAAGNRFRHVGAYAAVGDNLPDERAHTVHAPLRADCRQVELVVHAQGTNIFIDEIALVEHAAKDEPSASAVLLAAGALEQDSKARLRQSYTQQFTATARRMIDGAANATAVRTWECDPWSGQLGEPASDLGRGAPARIVGTSVEHEVRCIGFTIPAAGNMRIVHDAGGALSVASVQPIVAANGRVVFDPVTPLDGGVIPNDQNLGFGYLWLDFDLAMLGAGEHRVGLRFLDADGATLTEVPLDVEVRTLDAARFPPFATVWAYSDAKPVWDRPAAAVADLAAHGVTVNVIPPHRMPQPRADGRWPLAEAVKLKTDLRLFAKNSSLILLALGWHPGVKPKWLPASPRDWSQAQRRIVERWYGRLTQVMSSAGIPAERWALYPVDELHGEKAHYFVELLDKFSEMGVAPRWYANPTQARRGVMREPSLAAVAGRVAYWQPSLKFAEQDGRRFFAALDQPWWVYHNPPYPAKSAAPLEHYLLPAWRAWLLGAAGSGVWAYSDTQGSSAWDDLDGRRADWALVYESDDGVVGSRRWTAFREGLEDLALLRHLAATGCVNDALRARIAAQLHSARMNTDGRDALRQELLGRACR